MHPKTTQKPPSSTNKYHDSPSAITLMNGKQQPNAHRYWAYEKWTKPTANKTEPGEAFLQAHSLLRIYLFFAPYHFCFVLSVNLNKRTLISTLITVCWTFPCPFLPQKRDQEEKTTVW